MRSKPARWARSWWSYPADRLRAAPGRLAAGPPWPGRPGRRAPPGAPLSRGRIRPNDRADLGKHIAGAGTCRAGRGQAQRSPGMMRGNREDCRVRCLGSHRPGRRHRAARARAHRHRRHPERRPGPGPGRAEPHRRRQGSGVGSTARHGPGRSRVGDRAAARPRRRPRGQPARRRPRPGHGAAPGRGAPPRRGRRGRRPRGRSGPAARRPPGFPPADKPTALAHARALDEVYREIQDLDWTYISPARVIGPGERTGEFRVGGERLLVDASGESRISIPDFAIAFADELEHGEAFRRRITVAY